MLAYEYEIKKKVVSLGVFTRFVVEVVVFALEKKCKFKSKDFSELYNLDFYCHTKFSISKKLEIIA